MNIYQVTELQKSLLDKMWSMDSVEEMERWMRTLSHDRLMEVRVLRDLMYLSMIDEEVEEKNDTSMALKMIEGCR
jgi:hypothetical protein